MGLRWGFELSPRLTASDADKKRWLAYLDMVCQVLSDRTPMKVTPEKIVFEVGQRPALPTRGYEFVEFSSDVGTPENMPARWHILRPYAVAECYFGRRVQFWDQLIDENGQLLSKRVADLSQRDRMNSILRFSIQFATRNSVSATRKRITTDAKTSTETSSANAELSTATDASKIAQAFALGPLTVEEAPLLATYRILEVPEKGLGVIASQHIRKGTLIMSEPVLIQLPGVASSPGDFATIVDAELRELPKEKLRAYFSLFNNFVGSMPAAQGIAKTNALPISEFEAGMAGVFRQISRINHACVPNCHKTWNQKRGEETVYAASDIDEGEEITICYMQYTGPSLERQLRTQRQYGFSCRCKVCTLPPLELIQSDERMQKAASLWHEAANLNQMFKNPTEHLALVHSLIKLFGAVNIVDMRLLGAYNCASSTVIAHGDQARARIFALKMHILAKRCEGEGSSLAEETRRLTLKPSLNAGYMNASRKWKRRERMIPRRLDSRQFENWLFRIKD